MKPDEMGDSLCNYCLRTDRGEYAQGGYGNHYYSCEGSYCEEAYETYIDENEYTEQMIDAHHKTEVKLLSEKNKADETENKQLQINFDIADVLEGITAKVKDGLEEELKKFYSC